MRVSFTLPVKTFSINSMYYGDARTKTQAAREWSYRVFHNLSKPEISEKLIKLREAFDPSKHGYVIRLTAYYPREIVYTQKGVLSAKCHDISNWEKPLIDLIFLDKYTKKAPPYGAENLCIDDKFLISLSSRKKRSDDDEYSIKVQLAIVPLDPLSHRASPQSQHDE